MSSGRFPDHFSEHAEAYVAHRPSYPATLVDYLADVAPRTELAWEAGCGSGQLSALLPERFRRVIATDASAEQLARAGAHPRVEYRQALAESSGLPGDSVDLAVAAQAAHWFDIERYYEEVRRVAAPGALVALISYGPTRISAELDPIFEEFRVGTLAAFWPPQRRHVEDGYRSLPFPFEEIDPPAFEIRLEWSLDDLLAYARTWSALRRMEAAERRELLEALRRRMAPAWGGGGGGGPGGGEKRRAVAWPLSLRIGYCARTK